MAGHHAGAVALVVGAPLGVAAGRWTWTLLADQLGLVAEAVTPLTPVLLLFPLTFLLANRVAAAAGWLAGRIRPAVALRTE